ncbi:MAG: VWA domain-containing protein [Chloroflexi bacterium]|nr:VWA domain-containing protein [Chloroflexota bacterium]
MGATRLRTTTSIGGRIYDKVVKFEPGATAGTWQPYVDAASSPEGRVEPREFCRVRAYPNSVIGGRSPVTETMRNELYGFFGANYGEQFNNIDPAADDPTLNKNYSGFVPQYDYFGCCNDPDGVLDGNGNFDFSDLVCQPFREARDAAEEFLARLDFLRGDRVAFVTFDRFATIIDPDGNGLQSAMIETEFDLFDTDGTTLLRRGANNALNSLVGVRAEDSTYYDSNNDGNWDRLLDYGTPRTYDDLLSGQIIGNVKDHPVRGACPFDSANLWNFWTLHDTLPDGSARPYDQMLLTDIHSVPFWYTGTTSAPSVSYEYRASCRGTNIGGALRAGADALYTTARREGAVWVMVLLSDGAAGASDPVSRTGDYGALNIPQPYHLVDSTNYNQPLNAMGNNEPLDDADDYPLPVEVYAAYGVCPYGSDTNFGEILRDTVPPYCMDLEPQTRNVCGATAVNPALIRLDDYPLSCYQFYDVDDYARDWADWIGLSELPGAVVDDAGTSRLSDQLLPTIFTIGFGLNFDAGTGISCGGDPACMRGTDPRNVKIHQEKLRQDYLGEELLRYIADVGDNFQIDTDYWQQYIGSRIGNAPPDWGQRGPCEQTTIIGSRGSTYQPLDPTLDCGNYFNASGGAELAEVFNEIASRMFTRLSG